MGKPKRFSGESFNSTALGSAEPGGEGGTGHSIVNKYRAEVARGRGWLPLPSLPIIRWANG